MKVAMVLDDTLDAADGVQQYVLAVGREVERRGNEVHYLVGHTLRTDLAHVHSLTRLIPVRFNRNRMRTPIPPSTATLRSLMAREDFDVLHVQTPYSPFLAGRLIRLASPRVRVVATFHIAPYSRLVRAANRALGVLTRRSSRRVDAWLADSTVAADFAREVYGVSSQVVPCPVDTTLAQQYREETRPAERPATIVFLGRLVPRKGPGFLLDAVAAAESAGTLPARTRVVVVGDGPQRAQLETQAAALRTHVEFVGTVDEPTKYKWLAQADVAAFPATGGESFGIVLPEAMAAGSRVIIAGNNPGYCSTLAGSQGQLVDPRNGAAFAAALVRGLTDADFIDACTAYQRRRLEDFSVTRVVDALERCYEGRPASSR